MTEHNKRSFSEVTQVIRDYVKVPEEIHDSLLGKRTARREVA